MSVVGLLIVALCLAVAVLALLVRHESRSVCERRALELKIRDLERILALRGDLANEVAHELKNPLTAILCSAETLDLLIGPGLDELHRRSLRYIKDYGDHLLRLVSDFLEVSRAEAGFVEPRPEGVNVVDCVESVTGLLESFALRKHITIHQNIPDRALMAYVDSKHLKQVVFNLVHNAIKFTPDRGEIEVEVARDFPHQIIVVSVKDTGAGISAEEIPCIFDPYVQYERQSAAHDPGTGLGLALCKNLIELAGGSITVRSKEGVGSVFAFALPEFAPTQAYNDDVERTLQETVIVAGERPLHGKSVLVLDGDDGARESLSSLIKAWGAIVEKTSDVDRALALLAKNSYDVVMVDEEVDTVPADELTGILRGLPKKDAKAPAVILTTRDPKKEDKPGDSGADHTVKKPINGNTLLATLLKPGRWDVTH